MFYSLSGSSDMLIMSDNYAHDKIRADSQAHRNSQLRIIWWKTDMKENVKQRREH